MIQRFAYRDKNGVYKILPEICNDLIDFPHLYISRYADSPNKLVCIRFEEIDIDDILFDKMIEYDVKRGVLK